MHTYAYIGRLKCGDRVVNLFDYFINPFSSNKLNAKYTW